MNGVTTLAAVAALALAGCRQAEQPSAQSSTAATQEGSSMELTSSAFTDGAAIPADYTCDGAGRSPPLAWRDPPANTRSFVLAVEDPDAPTGTFRHWGVYDIPADRHRLDADAGRNGGLKLTKNGFDKPGYGPPCPPRGDPPHHYHFRLMALDVEHLPGSPSSVKDLIDAASNHVLGSAELVGTYGRT